MITQESTDESDMTWLWIVLAVLAGLCSSLLIGGIFVMLRSKKNKQNSENNNSVELGSTDAPELLSARDDDDAFTRDNASSAGNEYSDLQLRTQSSASGTYDFGDGSR